MSGKLLEIDGDKQFGCALFSAEEGTKIPTSTAGVITLGASYD